MANTSEQKNDSPKSGKIVVYVGIVVIILLLVVIIFLLLSRNSNTGKEEVQETKRSVVLTADNAGDIISEMVESQQEEVPEEIGYYSATMNYEWKFPAGDEPSSNAYVENNTDNVKDVYFDLFLAEDESEPIYKSPIIPVGSNLSGFSLDKKLDKGTYKCICEYHLVDEEQNTLSTLRVKVTVIVEQ